jgi:hypothetical protein
MGINTGTDFKQPLCTVMADDVSYFTNESFNNNLYTKTGGNRSYVAGNTSFMPGTIQYINTLDPLVAHTTTPYPVNEGLNASAINAYSDTSVVFDKTEAKDMQFLRKQPYGNQNNPYSNSPGFFASDHDTTSELITKKGLALAQNGTDTMGFTTNVTVPTNVKAKLLMRLYQSAVDVPTTITLPCNTHIRKQTTLSRSAADGLDKEITINTESFTLSEVPQRIFLYAVAKTGFDGTSNGTPTDGYHLSQPDMLLNITNVNFRTTGNVGTLSSAKGRQLYQMARRNGLTLTEKEFLQDGNVVCVNPSSNLGGWVNGSREAFSHDFEVKVRVPGYINGSENLADLVSRVPGEFTTKVVKTPLFSMNSSVLSRFNGNDSSSNLTDLSEGALPNPYDEAKVVPMRNVTKSADLNKVLSWNKRKLVESEIEHIKQTMNKGGVVLYVVYEMKGQVLLTADGQLVQTSGIDVKDISESLQTSGVHANVNVGNMDPQGGGLASFYNRGKKLIKYGTSHLSHSQVNLLQHKAHELEDHLRQSLENKGKEVMSRANNRVQEMLS